MIINRRITLKEREIMREEHTPPWSGILLVVWVVGVLLFLQGCASTEPQESDEIQQIDRELVQEAWDSYVAWCHSKKGVIVRRSHVSVRLNRPPRQYERVSCISRERMREILEGQRW